MVYIEAIFFVLSSGLLFNNRFRSNYALVVVAGIIALGSSYLLFEEFTKRLIKSELEASGRPTVITSPVPPITPAITTSAPSPAASVVTRCIIFNGRDLCP